MPIIRISKSRVQTCFFCDKMVLHGKISIFSYVDKNHISVYNKREHTFDGGCYEKG